MRNIGKEETPSQVFDLIVGTSTGGLIALLVGRLEKSTTEAIKAYQKMGQEIFGVQGVQRWVLQGQFDESKLVDSIKEVIGGTAPGTKLLVDDSLRCRVSLRRCSNCLKFLC